MDNKITQLLFTAIQYLVMGAIEVWNYANELSLNEQSLDEPQPTCPHCFMFYCIEDPQEFAWEEDIWNYFFNSSSKKEDEDSQTISTPSITPPVNYVDKYKKELNERLSYSNANNEKSELPLSDLKKKVLIENTPFGNVIMYYDSSKSSFVYYCDKTLSYPIVNTVGRKYVLTFRCESLYIDESSPISQKPSTEVTSSSPTPTNPQPNNLQKNVYAKFKNYKKTTTQSTSTESTTLKQEEQINRYTCEGKISNFSFLQNVPKTKRLSYKDFKKQIKSA